MKLKTSFFNPTVLKKDLTRFSPLWVLYTVFMTMYLLLLWESDSTAARFANNAPYIMQAMGVVMFFYAGITALLLFSDLFNPRMANMLHALPMRREGWFLTHLCSGLLICLVPNLLGGLITALFLGQYAGFAFLWMAVVSMECLFFFGVAAFCVMCAGNALGALAMYGIVNYLSILAGWLIKVFYEPFLYGMRIDLDFLAQLSPVVALSGFTFMDSHYDNLRSITVLDRYYPDQWLYLGIAAAVGVLLLAAALGIYRKRHLETAGDFISFPYVAPVFLGIYTLFVAALIYFVTDALSGSLGGAFLVVGLTIGFFTGKMLLEKRVRVFRWKNILAFLISLAVFFSTIGLTVLDPIGLTRYVPQADQVASVTISPYDSIYPIQGQSCTVTEAADVEAVIGLHQLALDTRYDNKENSIPLHIRYQMKNGSTVERTYQLPESNSTTLLLKGFYSRPEAVLGTADPQVFLQRLVSIEFYPHSEDLPFLMISRNIDQEDVREQFGKENTVVAHAVEGNMADDPVVLGLVEAMYADCHGKAMSQWQPKTVGSMSIIVEIGGYREYLDVTISQNSVNTLGYLRSLTEK